MEFAPCHDHRRRTIRRWKIREEFITEHYWGYTAQRNGGCTEYKVEHPRWNVWKARERRTKL